MDDHTPRVGTDTGRGAVPLHQHRVATCNVCGQDLYVACAGSPVAQLALAAQAATAEHLADHTGPERARYVVTRLRSLPLEQRLPALRLAARDVGAEDRAGVYGIDEALGGAALYRLWLEANRCERPGCVHRDGASTT